MDPWTDTEQRTVGSMALFDPPDNDIRFHTQFAKSIVSERLENIPLAGKGYKTIWNVIDRSNNHFLDAAGYACAAAATLGVRLVQTAPPVNKTEQRKSGQVKPAVGSNRFRQRPGGWVQGTRQGRRK